MCDACRKAGPAKLRDKLTPEELSRYQHLKTITDGRRLAAMLPAYIKAHMRVVAPPGPRARFIPGLPPKYPPLPSGTVWHTAQHSLPLPDILVELCGIVDARAYVAAYYKAAHHVA